MLDACLMVQGSWLRAYGQGGPAKAHGSWPREAGPAPGARGALFSNAIFLNGAFQKLSTNILIDFTNK